MLENYVEWTLNLVHVKVRLLPFLLYCILTKNLKKIYYLISSFSVFISVVRLKVFSQQVFVHLFHILS